MFRIHVEYKVHAYCRSLYTDILVNQANGLILKYIFFLHFWFSELECVKDDIYTLFV